MLTTSVDGLWVLQVLTGTEVLVSELALRPHLPSVETKQMAMAHSAAAELQSVGAIDGDGAVDPVVAEWLTVLSRRDVSLIVNAQSPWTPGPERIVLARFAQWWVALERWGHVLRMSGVGTADDEYAASQLIRSQIERLCGAVEPAAMRPVSLDATALLRDVRDTRSFAEYLRSQRVDPDQNAILALAADHTRSAQLTIIATQAGAPGSLCDSGTASGAVTVIDTPMGRLAAERVVREGADWLIVGPGSTTQITAAVQRMLRRLPSEDEWFSYRKAFS